MKWHLNLFVPLYSRRAALATDATEPYSLQVSPEWHLKKKLAATLERSKAYNVLTSYKSLNIKGNRAIIQLNRFIKLSEIDKNIILQQIQATHEKMDDNGDYKQV